MNLLEKDDLRDFADKDYRDGYLDAVTRSGIAYQLKALRKKFGFSQSEMAEATGKTQSVISRLESSEGRASVQTLIEIASSLKVALLVRFVSFPEFLAHANNMSERSLQPDTIDESLEKAAWRIVNERSTSIQITPSSSSSASAVGRASDSYQRLSAGALEQAHSRPAFDQMQATLAGIQSKAVSGLNEVRA